MVVSSAEASDSHVSRVWHLHVCGSRPPSPAPRPCPPIREKVKAASPVMVGGSARQRC